MYGLEGEDKRCVGRAGDVEADGAGAACMCKRVRTNVVREEPVMSRRMEPARHVCARG